MKDFPGLNFRISPIMRKSLSLILLVIVVFFLSECTSLRRYNSVAAPGTDSALADIDLFGIRISQAKPVTGAKSLWDLSADAQSQFIKILNTRFPDNNRFLQSLSFEYLKGDRDLPVIDYVSKDLRLIFSVSRKPAFSKDPASGNPELSTADRLEYIKISLVLRDSSVNFTGWNIYSTEYGSIEIGDVSFAKSLDVTGAAALTAKKVNTGADLSAGAGVAFNRKEDQSLRQRYLKLSGRINKQKIEMEEEGTRETDLTGNIIADVSLRFDKTAEMIALFKKLKDSTGAFNLPEKLSSEVYLVSVPKKRKIDDFIQADLKMDFVYRNVQRGARTFQEWDDRVKYYRGTVRKTIPLFSAPDYVPDFYSIGSISENDNRYLVELERGNGNLFPLIFSSYDEAAAFYEWLMNCLAVSKGNAIKIGDLTLKFRNVSLSADLVKHESRFGVLPYYW
jgi:hypothetical protein